MDTHGNWEGQRCSDRAADGAGDTGVGGLDLSLVGFSDNVSPKRMPDEVVGREVCQKPSPGQGMPCVQLVLLTVPLQVQEQPGGMDCISGAASLDEAALVL